VAKSLKMESQAERSKPERDSHSVANVLISTLEAHRLLARSNKQVRGASGRYRHLNLYLGGTMVRLTKDMPTQVTSI